MRLTEFDGKALLRRHGIAVPRGALLRAGDDDAQVRGFNGLVAKAQVLEGGRGKRGLVKPAATLDALPSVRAAITAALGDDRAPLLIEESVSIAREIFVAVRIDGTRQILELLVTPQGGVEVESGGEVARIALDPIEPTSPDVLYPYLTALFAKDLAVRLARFCARLPDIMRAEDLELLEINPLVVTDKGRLVACDAKIVRDDSAAFRHDTTEFSLSHGLDAGALTPLERKARDQGFQLVEMDGDVALVTAGAGLGMMMIDLIADHGLRAACFMDNLQGGPPETIEERLSIAREIAMRPGVKAMVFQTVLASRSLAERVEALLAWVAAEPPPKPLYVGIAAGHQAARVMSAEQAIERLGAVGIRAFTDPVTLVKSLAADLGVAKR